MELVLSACAAALALVSIGCAVLLPARIALATVQKASRRVVRDVQDLLEESETQHAKLRAHMLEVLDMTERKRKSVAASASKLQQNNAEPYTQEELLSAIEQRHRGTEADWGT